MTHPEPAPDAREIRVQLRDADGLWREISHYNTSVTANTAEEAMDAAVHTLEHVVATLDLKAWEAETGHRAGNRAKAITSWFRRAGHIQCGIWLEASTEIG